MFGIVGDIFKLFGVVVGIILLPIILILRHFGVV